MKKFFKVVTVSTMGLLFVLSNDVVAATAGAISADGVPPVGASPAQDSMRLFGPMLEDSSQDSIARYLQGFIDPTYITAISPSTPKSLVMTGHTIVFSNEKSFRTIQSTIRLHVKNFHDIPPSNYDMFENTMRLFGNVEFLHIHSILLGSSTPAATLPSTIIQNMRRLKSLKLVNIALTPNDILFLKHREMHHVTVLGRSHNPETMKDFRGFLEHIIKPDSTYDAASKAFAHSKLGGREFGGNPLDPSNPHALAILALGLPTTNRYVLWASVLRYRGLIA